MGCLCRVRVCFMLRPSNSRMLQRRGPRTKCSAEFVFEVMAVVVVVFGLRVCVIESSHRLPLFRSSTLHFPFWDNRLLRRFLFFPFHTFSLFGTCFCLFGLFSHT